MSSFTDDQARFIVLKFGGLKSPSKVKRAFRQKYFPSNSEREQLKGIDEDFTVNMDEDDVRKMTAQERRRAELCVQQAGGHFHHLL